MSCDCACHSNDPDSPGCPDCSAQHETEVASAGPRRAPIDELRAMPRPQKLILAGNADRATRALLMRDVDAQVLYYLCKNPRITLDEVLEITKLATINGPVADLIAATSQWIASEQVRLNLVLNPKTPTPTALKLIGGLNIKNLQAMAKSFNVKPQIKQAALKLVLERGR
jgi:hypothetical protein